RAGETPHRPPARAPRATRPSGPRRDRASPPPPATGPPTPRGPPPRRPPPPPTSSSSHLAMASVEEYAAQTRSRRLRRLALTAEHLQAAIEDSAARAGSLARRPAAGAWAPVEVICHLRDSEEWFLTRCRFILEMAEPAFP